MKVLLLTDKRNWAYHSIAKSLVKYNKDTGLKISVLHIKTDVAKIKKVYHKYDRILVMGWQCYERVDFIPPHKCLIGLHSHHSWDKRQTMPDESVDPPRKFVKFLSSFEGVNAVSRRLYELFKKAGVERITYTPNGADIELFTSRTPPKRTGASMVAGYSGSQGHDWRKGTSEFIIPSCKKAGVKYKLAMPQSDGYLSLEEMPKFYNSIDCYVCASSSEGFSLSVLEAAACGRPIITTRVGGMDELIVDGQNGFFVDRTVKDISSKLNILKNDQDMLRAMGQSMRDYVVKNLSWEKQSQAWYSFLKGG